LSGFVERDSGEAGPVGTPPTGRVRRPRLLALAVAVVLSGTLGAATLVAAPATGGRARPVLAGSVIPDSYLVALKDGAPTAVAAEHAALGVRVDRVFTHALDGYMGRMTADVAATVARDPRVQAVTLDRRLTAAGQETPPGVVRAGAPRSLSRSGDGKGAVDADIAVLDTGIDIDHPDLNVVGGVDCVDQGAGLFGPLGDATAASVGADPAPSATPTPSKPADYDDPKGHGTHIAGIAAAKDNGLGVVGIAPGARLWAVRVLDADGNGSLGTLVCGIDWVTAHADVIDVANMSLSGLDTDKGCSDGGLHEAICRSVAAGVTYTVAAGNAGDDAANYSPASYDEVLTVSALADYDGRPGGLAPTPSGCPGTDDDFAGFSNFGPDVDLVAPGVCIASTWKDGGYAELTGTSQAAAHAAGAAALYVSKHPDATPAQVRAALIAAGSQDWFTSTDPDDRPDPLLDVEDF
jgi:subtilisin family serine protease